MIRCVHCGTPMVTDLKEGFNDRFTVLITGLPFLRCPNDGFIVDPPRDLVEWFFSNFHPPVKAFTDVAVVAYDDVVNLYAGNTSDLEYYTVPFDSLDLPVSDDDDDDDDDDDWDDDDDDDY